jgi:DNA excision repair protein ERCC-4
VYLSRFSTVNGTFLKKSPGMLSFQKEMISEFGSNSLLIAAKGLCLEQSLVHLVQIYKDPRNLVILLNVKEIQLEMLKKDLQNLENFTEINAETNQKTRSGIYSAGGVVSVTLRILVVDMLNKIIPTIHIHGILIYNAHSIQSYSILSFILKIYRTANKTGFIKALSDQPEIFCEGINGLERRMKMLQVNNLNIYPRFHLSIKRDLDFTSIDVIEDRVGLSKRIKAVQAGLMECLVQMLQELKRMHPFLDIDTMKLENSFSKSFSVLIRSQLENVWQSTSAKTRQIVNDLNIVRDLLRFLLQYDAVLYFNLVETEWQTAIQNKKSFYSERNSFSWIDLDAAGAVLSEARKRVFVKDKDASEDDSNIPKGYKLTLEEQPKWRALLNILVEIDQERRTKCQSRGTVLVMCNGGKTTDQLRQIISKTDLSKPIEKMDGYSSPGTRKILLQNVYKYFKWKSRMATVTERMNAEARPVNLDNKLVSKRRRVHKPSEPVQDDSDKFQSEARNIQDFFTRANDAQFPECTTYPSSHISVRAYASFGTDTSSNDSTDCNILDFLQPTWIVMYDPDASFIRRIEVYKSSFQKDFKVYFMTYDNSFEEQVYLTSLRREKEAFEKLIEQKATIAIPVDERGLVVVDPEAMFFKNSTRNAAETKVKKVLVDVREFRAALPLLIYSRRIEVVPCTIEVGDYILSPDIAIERKSPSDLAQSLKSGRLYKQAQAMNLHYKNPMLLVEFPQNNSFSLTFGLDNEFCTLKRLVLLLIHFPKLSVIWSSSPLATGEIFEDLQRDKPDPILEDAQACGLESETKLDKTTNQTPMEMLLCLPGISFKNYKVVMSKVKNIKELSEMSKEACCEMIGPEFGRMLYGGFHSPISVTTS